MPNYKHRASIIVAFGIMCLIASSASAQRTEQAPTDANPGPAERPAAGQAELDAAFIKMLSGATLEGTFTSTSPGSDPTKLSREMYTLGEVKKLQGNLWLIPARIQYGEHDVTLPLTLPIRWAGDTPVIVVDNVGLPGFGAVSARVMFFEGHYAGYWRHGDHGGHLFGIIRSGDAATPKPASRINPATDKQPHQ